MPNFCVVNGCKNPSKGNKENSKHIKFFCFPKNCEIQKLWVEACANKNVNTKTGRICSLHFTDDDWRLKDILLNTPIEKRFLKPNAVPSVMMPKIKLKTTLARERRAAHRNSKKTIESAIEDYEMRILKEKDQNTDVFHDPIDFEVSPTTKSIDVQTVFDFNCEKELQIIALQKKIKELEEENKLMKTEIEQAANLEHSIEKMFTSVQIKRMKNPNCNFHWTIDDISASICLHSAEPSAYRYLTEHNYPLPAESTLRRWASKLDIKPGILYDVIRYMKDYNLDEELNK